jgi:hypothetical protein
MAPPGLASGIRADQRSSTMASGICFACCTQRASELRKEQVFVSIAITPEANAARWPPCQLHRRGRATAGLWQAAEVLTPGGGWLYVTAFFTV